MNVISSSSKAIDSAIRSDCDAEVVSGLCNDIDSLCSRLTLLCEVVEKLTKVKDFRTDSTIETKDSSIVIPQYLLKVYDGVHLSEYNKTVKVIGVERDMNG